MDLQIGGPCNGRAIFAMNKACSVLRSLMVVFLGSKMSCMSYLIIVLLFLFSNRL